MSDPRTELDTLLAEPADEEFYQAAKRDAIARENNLSDIRAAQERFKPFEAKEKRNAEVLKKYDALGSDLSPSNKGGTANPLSQSFAHLPKVGITCAADIKPEPIIWLWDGYIARGKFHVVAGMAGTGKTTIVISLAATISKGGKFPDGTRAPVGNIVIWSGEDSAKDTLVPRLLADGADMTKVFLVGDVKHGDEIRSFDPATDMKALMDEITRIGDVCLLIIDPVVNAVAGDTHKNGEVRRGLTPLVEFGEKLNFSIIGITHFSKGTGGNNVLERVTGSLAFGALARVVMATGKITEGETTRRIFCRVKSNIGPDDGGFEYTFLQKELTDHRGIYASSVTWGEAVEGSAHELLAEPDNRESDEQDNSALDDAKEFLKKLLADGELPQKEIQADAKGASHSWRTVERAKKELNVRSSKSTIDKCWYWGLSNSAKEVDTQNAGGLGGLHAGLGSNSAKESNTANTASILGVRNLADYCDIPDCTDEKHWHIKGHWHPPMALSENQLTEGMRI